MNLVKNKLFFISLSLLIFILLNTTLFSNLLHLKYVPINLLNQIINIYKDSPETWAILKNIYNVFFVVSSIIISNYLYSILKPFHTFSTLVNSSLPFEQINKELHLFIGIDENSKKTFIPEKGLYQNLLVTGSIGSRENK